MVRKVTYGKKIDKIIIQLYKERYPLKDISLHLLNRGLIKKPINTGRISEIAHQAGVVPRENCRHPGKCIAKIKKVLLTQGKQYAIEKALSIIAEHGF